MLPIADPHSARRRGMSLVELIVAIAIFTTIMSGVILMFNSVTNTVRRSYRTIDLYDQTNGALQAMERDIQTMFNNPATGEGVRFYGEPFGFVIVGIDESNELSRITYAVHRDTRGMHDPTSLGGRGQTVLVGRLLDDPLRARMNRFNIDLRDYYHVEPDPNGGDPYVTLEVEVITGLLVRFFEEDVKDYNDFPVLDRFVQATQGQHRMPRPAFFPFESLGNAASFPWLTRYLWPGTNHPNTTAYVYNTFETIETCHYWLQLLNGPGIPPIALWDRTDIWWRERMGAEQIVDQFWYDDVLGHGELPNPNPGLGHAPRYHLQQYVVAENFVLHAYLLDPATGQRIAASDGGFVEILGPRIDPYFHYAVEDYGQRSTTFNTLFNLDFGVERGEPGLISHLMEDLNDPVRVDNFSDALTSKRRFYDLGNPLQGRAPVAVDVCFWTLQDAVTTGGAASIHRFAKTIYLPTGYMRPQQMRQ